jgi:hypothetical protein
VLTGQAQTTLDQLAAPDNAPRLQLLNDEQGFDTKRFAKELAKANTALCTADADQEARKVDCLDEAHDDQSDAEAGYRWKLRFDARVRNYIREYGVNGKIGARFRLGSLHAASSRGVLEALRVVMPEVLKRQKQFATHGVTKAFVQEGQKLLATLDGGSPESEAAKAARIAATKKVRAGELEVSRLLDRIRGADEAVALDLIKAERARLQAERQARLEATVPGPNEPMA